MKKKFFHYRKVNRLQCRYMKFSLSSSSLLISLAMKQKDEEKPFVVQLDNILTACVANISHIFDLPRSYLLSS